MSGGLLLLLALAGAVTGSARASGLAAGMVLGIVDLVGLGLRLPLWAKLNQRAATMSMNLRFLSRLALVGVYFYALRRFTQVNVFWTLAGLFVPHALYLVGAVWQQRGKGVNG